eukprot:GHVU01027911.1.p1 GENE.GHVU01027911.1~~GHVU01027911.1.p1  ORF type:complete len:135 (-),score=7.27 GHVU01027911.1:51-455(-)
MFDVRTPGSRQSPPHPPISQPKRQLHILSYVRTYAHTCQNSLCVLEVILARLVEPCDVPGWDGWKVKIEKEKKNENQRQTTYSGWRKGGGINQGSIKVPAAVVRLQDDRGRWGTSTCPYGRYRYQRLRITIRIL